MNKPTIATTSKNEGDIALTYPGADLRIYSKSNIPGTIDCSRFTIEVAVKAGYGSLLPRKANEQSKWYQKNGHWSTNIIDVQKGDHIFWNRGGGEYHTGIVVSVTVSKNIRIIGVVQAQTHGHRPGSIMFQQLKTDGSIFSREDAQPFVGVGRYP